MARLPCLYLMRRAGVETLQNPVRCKNLLRQAEERLLAGGLRPLQAQELLEPVQQLFADFDFWQHQNDGLALFLAAIYIPRVSLTTSLRRTGGGHTAFSPQTAAVASQR